MDNWEHIKNKIESLQKTAKEIHITVQMQHPKMIIENMTAEILGAYRNIFRVREKDSGYSRCFTFKYTDIMIGHVVINELDF